MIAQGYLCFGMLFGLESTLVGIYQFLVFNIFMAMMKEMTIVVILGVVLMVMGIL